jgi:hypothetical protein
MPCPSSSSTASAWVVDLGERQLLAQPVALPPVALGVDRMLEQERFVQPIELLLDGLDALLLLGRSVLRVRATLLPGVENPVLDEPHVARGWLQEGELAGERAFERVLADVDRPALALTVVVGVVGATESALSDPGRPDGLM